MRHRNPSVPTTDRADDRLELLELAQLRAVTGGLGNNRGNQGRAHDVVPTRNGWGDGSPNNTNTG